MGYETSTEAYVLGALISEGRAYFCKTSRAFIMKGYLLGYG
jgi:hypothetical protein